MKKKILFIISLVTVLLLLVPIPMKLRDGGSIEYKAVLYKITDVKRINLQSSSGYEEGTIIEVLGFQVFNNVSFDVLVEVHQIDGVSMSIMDDTLTPTSAKVIIKDTNKDKYVYGEEFFIEKKVEGVWKKLDPIVDSYGFNDMGYLVGDSNKLGMIQDWTNIYGALTKGEYRLVKNVFDDGYKYFSVEFEI